MSELSFDKNILQEIKMKPYMKTTNEIKIQSDMKMTNEEEMILYMEITIEIMKLLDM